MSRENTFPTGAEGVVLCHPALWNAACIAAAAGCESVQVHATAPFGYCTLAQATWGLMANHGSIRDSPAGGGAMALLGCPREHMVPRETWSCGRTRSLTRPGYLPSNPSAQRQRQRETHPLCPAAARSNRMWCQIVSVERLSFLPHM